MNTIILKNTKSIAVLSVTFAMALFLSACDHANKTTNGSMDTTSVNRAGGPAITDTATVTAQEKAAAKDSANKDTTSKGNVDPKGYVKKQ